MWAALRSGLYWTPINWHLTAEEAAYIAGDCEARAILTSGSLAQVAEEMVPLTPRIETRLICDAPGAPSHRPRALRGGLDRGPLAEPLEDAVEGAPMMYSSGTTGRPKGILPPLPGIAVGEVNPIAAAMSGIWGFSEQDASTSRPLPSTTPRPASPPRPPSATGAPWSAWSASTRPAAWRPSSATASPTPSSCRPCSCACSSCRGRSAKGYDVSSRSRGRSTPPRRAPSRSSAR